MRNHLPQIVRWMISQFATGKDKEIIEGDFEEAVSEAKPHSFSYYFLMTKELFGLMRFSHLRRKRNRQPSGLGANMVKVILRNLKRNLSYTLINVVGLSISLMVFALIMAYVTHELSYDRYHEDHEQIFRVTFQENVDEPIDGHWARVPLDWINNLPDYFPQVEQFVRFQSFRFRDIQVNDQSFREHFAFSVDPKVFEVLDLKFIHGDPKHALSEPKSVVLTETSAIKYFDALEVMGKAISILSNAGVFESYQVTGVIKDIPDNSHLPINLLTSIDSNERTGWAYIFVKLQKEADAATIAEQMPNFIETHAPDPETTATFNLQPIADIHLKSHLSREISINNHISYILIFLGASLFLVIVAVINFANLNTVQSLGRSRELGVRKVLGGSSTHLRQYFYLESFMLFCMSLMIGTLGYSMLLGYLEHFMGQRLQPDHTVLIFVVLVLLFSVPWLSCIYAAQGLVRLSVIQALKAQLQQNRKLPGRKLLIGLQFGLAMALISAMHITQKQFQFLQNKNLGFQEEQILAIRHMPDEAKQNIDILRHELTKLPGIEAVSAVMELPGSAVQDGVVLLKPGQKVDDGISVDIQIVEPNFPKLMQMEFIAGNTIRSVPYPPFPKVASGENVIATINERKRSYVINETAAQLMGWNNPKDAIGATISGFNSFYQLAEGPIVGVVKNYHQESLRAAIDPVVMVFEPIWLSHLLVKINGSNLFQTSEQIESQWNDRFAGFPIDMVFLDQEMNRLYEGERKQKELLEAFTIITLMVATLGLLGLMGYSLRIRQKELAVRKVLGANLMSLVQLLAKEYLSSLLVGVCLAIPLVWLAMDQWLQYYAYHTEIQVMSFVLGASLLAILIVVPLVTQIIRNDRNPSEVLKSE